MHVASTLPSCVQKCGCTAECFLAVCTIHLCARRHIAVHHMAAAPPARPLHACRRACRERTCATAAITAGLLGRPQRAASQD